MVLDLVIGMYQINLGEFRATMKVADEVHNVGERESVRDCGVDECTMVTACSPVTGCLRRQVGRGSARAVERLNISQSVHLLLLCLGGM